MPRAKEPIDLILAKGNKAHLSKKEIQERKENEIDTSEIMDFEVPEHLNPRDKELFVKYATSLQNIGIFTELDVDMLERYIHAYRLYTLETSRLYKAVQNEDVDNMHLYQKMQDKAFNQCQSCARELGLSISSRCKLQIPKQEEKEEDYSAYFS